VNSIAGAPGPTRLRQPLGYSLAGGLVVSQILTLFTTRSSTCIWGNSGAFSPASAEIRKRLSERMSQLQPRKAHSRLCDDGKMFGPGL
jgi:hypothetical protein